MSALYFQISAVVQCDSKDHPSALCKCADARLKCIQEKLKDKNSLQIAGMILDLDTKCRNLERMFVNMNEGVMAILQQNNTTIEKIQNTLATSTTTPTSTAEEH